MSESNWSPLAHFKELHFLPRVIFTLGGVLFVASAFARDLPLILLSSGIVLAAAGANFVLNLTYPDAFGEGYHISWLSFWQGLIAVSISAFCLYLSVYIYRYGGLPLYLQPIFTLLKGLSKPS
jgi:hypothetical protein